MNYRAMPGGRILSRVSVLVFSLAAVAWIVAAALAPHQRAFPWWIAATWLVAAGWNIYWLGFRVCNEVRVEGSTLTWWTALRRGSAQLGDVEELRPQRFGRRMAVLQLRGRPSLRIPVRYGFTALTEALRAGAPGARIDAG